jgi:hypothetical protein
MKPATHFLFAFGLSINLFADFFVSAAFSSLASVNPLAGNATTSYIVELASPASDSGARRKRRSLTVSLLCISLEYRLLAPWQADTD